MKNSKFKWILFVLILTFLSSCDDRFDFVNTINDPPTIFFVGTDQKQVTDTVKVSLKHGQESFDFTLRYSDISGGRVSGIRANLSSGKLMQGNIEVGSNLDLSELSDREDQIALKFIHDGVGISKTYDLEFIVTDENGASDRINLILLAINNLKPIASFTATKLGTTSVFEYEFNATNSSDPDDYLGGGIQVYKWTINGTNTFFTNQAVIKHTFAGVAGYEVLLTVYDNDGEASTPFRTTIQVTGN